MKKKIKAQFKKSDELSTGLIPLVEGLTFKLSDEELEKINIYFEEEVKKIHNEFKKPLSTKLPDYAHTIIEKESKKLGVKIHTEYIAHKIFQRRSINSKAKGIFKKERVNQSDYVDKITKEELLEIIDEVHNDILKITKQPQHSEKKINYGFKSARGNNYFAKLKNKLVEEKFISEVGINEFKAIFSGKNIEEIKPLIWNKTLTELIYFIRQLISKRVIEGNLNRMNYEKIKSCFRNNKEEEISGCFSTINNHIKKAEKKDDFSEVMKTGKELIIKEIIDSSF